ncbi:MAG: anti-sigma factor [Chitinophagaceae bacterium]|nr:anti-sigma factor [Rubrivivax sp.]
MKLEPHHDALAAAYVLGTLQGPARSRLERLLLQDAALQARVDFWQQALVPMAASLSAEPSAAVWRAIAARVLPLSQAAAQGGAVQPGWFERWFGVRSFASMAAGLMLGVTLSVTFGWMRSGWIAGPDATLSETQLPESYVGVLAAANGKPGLIVSSRRHGTVMDVKQVQPVAVGPGRTLFLWAIDADGSTRAIGAVPSGPFVQVKLPAPSEQLFAKATELAVSIEAVGATPAAPTQAFAYRGLCGKLWRVPAPKK